MTAIKEQAIERLRVMRPRVGTVVEDNETTGIQLQLGLIGGKLCDFLLLCQNFLHDFWIKVFEYKAFGHEFL